MNLRILYRDGKIEEFKNAYNVGNYYNYSVEKYKVSFHCQGSHKILDQDEVVTIELIFDLNEPPPIKK